jgi:glyoxylase-like metal-dependent hydrolase (beta-lactamase superfamily II)
MTLKKELKMKQVTDGIYQIETFYLDEEGIAACYLIEDNGEIAFFETNTNHAVPFLLEAVKNLGFKPEQVKYVIVSHIHLDHAGGTGLLMKRLPLAELVVHARGKKHMINPEKLIDGVKQIYGEKKYKKLYGEILPIDKERVRSVLETDTIILGNRSIDLYDSPGHAKHHMFIFDRKTQSVLSGDAFGMSYPRFVFDHFRLVFPSTSPVQFEPNRSLETYQKIMGLNPSRVLLTHFGSIEDTADAHDQLKDWITFSTEIAEKRYSEGYRENELYGLLYKDIVGRFEQVIEEARGTGLTPEEKAFLVLDCDLNAQGLAHYIKKLRGKEVER